MLGVTYKTAWFMTHRIREAMIDTKAGRSAAKAKSLRPNEAYIGRMENRARHRSAKASALKRKHGWTGALSRLIETCGEVRMFHSRPRPLPNVRDILVRNVRRVKRPATTRAKSTPRPARSFRAPPVKHSAGEYVRYEEAKRSTKTQLRSVQRVSCAA